MYENGEGVPEDFVMAHVWYSLAAANGYKPANESMVLIKGKLSREQLDEAQKIQSGCLKSNYKDCNL
jgi:TPR repeat protein